MLRLPYTAGQTRITAPGTVVATLPAGPFNHHWSKNLLDIASGAQRVFASGLRNPNGLAWAPGGALWTVVNERAQTPRPDLVVDDVGNVVWRVTPSNPTR